MNLENIAEGQVFKNYSELCEAVGEKCKSGCSKKSQMEHWQRYFDFERLHLDSRKQGDILIKKIYDTPLAKPINKNAIFVKLIEILLMYELSTKKDCTCNYTTTRLYKTLGMVNDKYIENKDHIQKELKDRYGRHTWLVHNFYNRSSQKLNDILFQALNSMKKRCLLEYSEVYIIIRRVKTKEECEELGIPYVPEYENRDGLWVEKSKTFTPATPLEVEMILDCKKNILLEMGVPRIDAESEGGEKKIPFGHYKEFYEKVNDKLKELYDWEGCFREYQLIYTRKYIAHDIPVVKNEIGRLIANSKGELNSRIVHAIDTQAEIIYDKNKDNYEKNCDFVDEDGNLKAPLFEYPEDYVEIQQELANLLLRIDENKDENDNDDSSEWLNGSSH